MESPLKAFIVSLHYLHFASRRQFFIDKSVKATKQVVYDVGLFHRIDKENEFLGTTLFFIQAKEGNYIDNY